MFTLHVHKACVWRWWRHRHLINADIQLSSKLLRLRLDRIDGRFSRVEPSQNWIKAISSIQLLHTLPPPATALGPLCSDISLLTIIHCLLRGSSFSVLSSNYVSLRADFLFLPFITSISHFHLLMTKNLSSHQLPRNNINASSRVLRADDIC